MPKQAGIDLSPYAIPLLIAASFLAYAGIFWNGFVFDDFLLIHGDRYLRSWKYFGDIFTSSTVASNGREGSFYRPLQIFLYLCLYQIGGLSAALFHGLNLALHIATVVALYIFSLRMGFNRKAGLAAVLLWAVHPVNTEAVAYASGTADPLYSLLSIAGVLVLLPDFAPRRLVLSCVCFALALLTKEAAIIFPFLVILTICFADKTFEWRRCLMIWPLGLIAVIYIGMKFAFLGWGNAFHVYRLTDEYSGDILNRFYTSLATLPTYFQLIIWPVGLHMERSFPVYTSLWSMPVLTGLDILVTSVLIMMYGWKHRILKPLAWGLLWAMIVFIPYTGILLPVNAHLLEHWLYLPLAGLMLGAGESLARFLEKKKDRKFSRVLIVLTGTLVLLFIYATFQQNEIWHDPVRFYNNIFAQGEPAPRAHNNLGMEYMAQGHFDAAIEQFQLALDATEQYPRAHVNLAEAILSRSADPASVDKALKHFNRAIELDSRFVMAYDGLATFYEQTSQPDKAAFYRKEATRIRQSYVLPPT